MFCNKYEQGYQVDTYGNLDSFCMRLDCFEQPSYFELRKVSKVNPWIIFCDDINMCISKEDSQYIINPYSTGIRNEFQIVETWNITENFWGEISKKLREKDSILLKTAFNYVQDYAWWGEGFDNPDYLHTGHYSYIIGEDEKFLFIVDSPSVFLNIEKLRWLENKSIVRIPKEHFCNAFKKLCQLKSISYINLPEGEKEESEYFFKVLAAMGNNYALKNVGKDAMRIWEVAIGNCEVNAFSSLFGFHMLLSRRVILKKCIFDFKEKLEGAEDILRVLDISMNYWRQIKHLSKEYVYEKKNPIDRMKAMMESFKRNEDILMGKIMEIHERKI